MGAGGCTDNLSIQGTEQFGVKVAWVWTPSKGTELQRDQKDLVMRQVFLLKVIISEILSWILLGHLLPSVMNNTYRTSWGFEMKFSLVYKNSSVGKNEFWGGGGIPCIHRV